MTERDALRARAEAAEARAITTEERELLDAVKEIWTHTEQHTTYVEGVGYTSRSDQQRCEDPTLHAYLALVEGTAWKLYREARAALEDSEPGHE